MTKIHLKEKLLSLRRNGKLTYPETHLLNLTGKGLTPSANAKDENAEKRSRGQAIIFIALMIIVLLALVGLAVDGGRAVIKANDMQRAADAAALAGATYLPWKVPEAEARAYAVATSNGYTTGGGVVVTAVPDTKAANQLIVTITAPNNTVFLKVIGLFNYNLTRTATGAYDPPISMGGDLSSLGNGVFNPGNLASGPQNFWLSVKAPYTQVASGDAYSSRIGNTLEDNNPPDYTIGYYKCVRNDPANANPAPRALANQKCNQDNPITPDELNQLHIQNGGFKGYNYAIDVTGNDKVDVSLSDPGYVNNDTAGDDEACSGNRTNGIQSNGYGSGNNAASKASCEDFYTVYTLKDPNGNLVTGCSAGPHDTGNPRLVYGGDATATEPWNISTNPPSVFLWCRTILNDPGEYILNVRTAMPDELGFTDLQAYPSSLGTSRPTGSNDFGIVTVPEANTTTSQVHAITYMCIKVVLTKNNVDVPFELARVPVSDIGKTLHLNMFDLGDTSDQATIYVKDPNGNVIFSKLTTTSAPGATAMFDDTWMRDDYPIPSTYSCKPIANSPPDCWFRIVYHYSAGSGDTSTWNLFVDGSPVRLVN